MRRTSRRIMGVLVVTVLLAAACGDDGGAEVGDGSSSTTTEPATGPTTPTTSEDSTTQTDPPEPLTASFRGVGSDRIELGIAYVDFDQLFEYGFVDFTHGDEIAIWEALLAEVNDRGGVLGRSLSAVYDTHLPIGTVEAEESCIYFTEDEQVFAVMGLMVGESVLCVTEQQETIHVGHLLRQEWVERSVAPLVTADAVEERQLELLLTVLHETGRLEGRTVGVLTDSIAATSVDSVVRPFADHHGLDLASVGVVDDSAGVADVPASESQVRVFAERWAADGVDLLLVVGNNGIPRLRLVREAMPDIDVAVPAADVLRQASRAAPEDERPLYDGVLSLAGLSPATGEQAEEPLLAERIRVVEAAVPGLTVFHPGERSEPADWYAGIRNACTSLHVFVAAATAAGPELTNDSFRTGLESLGTIDLPGKAHASFGPGKWDADDGFRLVEFDPLDGGDGSFAELTDIIDTRED